MMRTYLKIISPSPRGRGLGGIRLNTILNFLAAFLIPTLFPAQGATKRVAPVWRRPCPQDMGDNSASPPVKGEVAIFELISNYTTSQVGQCPPGIGGEDRFKRRTMALTSSASCMPAASGRPFRRPTPSL